jgi:HD-GYP domain-containing protein (c-di-GMP phosphodiesterase class II)
MSSLAGATHTDTSNVRLAEVIGALSVATDLGMGHPLEFALCSCILAVRLGEASGLGEEMLREVYYQALLRYIGCNAETHLLAALIGDELALRRDFAAVNNGKQSEVMWLILRYLRQANAGESPLRLAGSLSQGLLAMSRVTKEAFAGHCEVAQRLALRLGFEPDIVRNLGQLYERWDGRGLPHGLKGEFIAPAVRVVTLAQDMVTLQRLSGLDAAVAAARTRRGAAYDPRLVDIFLAQAEALFAGLEDEPDWQSVLALEPGSRLRLSDAQFDVACEAIADFADIKSPYTLGHSPGVARLAAGAALRCRLPDADIVAIKRAGLLHDVGRVGVSAGIWTKPGALTEREWEQVRMHPYYSERVLARPGVLARLGTLASYHHERLDGSGYHRGVLANAQPPAARMLAAADVYQAMTEPRPHREAREANEAAAELRREARAGRLDTEAVEGVLATAGHPTERRQASLAAGLSQREIEVLRLIARGHSMQQIADLLFISRKTVDNHIQHIYAKTGVTTRAGATLFAMEQHLLNDILN